MGVDFRTFSSIMYVALADFQSNMEHAHYEIVSDVRQALHHELRQNRGAGGDSRRVKKYSVFDGGMANLCDPEAAKNKEPPQSSQSQMSDAVVASVILLNACVLAVSDPNSNDPTLDKFDYFFTGFFLTEVVIKIIRFGPKVFFFGPDWHWNNFDTAVVAVALVDTISNGIMAGDEGEGGFMNVTMFKILRLGRLARLVRLIRFRLFKELKMMVQ